MSSPNFISFFTVQGFFLGMIFGLIKSNSADGLLIYTFLITGFFYLFSHIIVAFYIKTISVESCNFAKHKYESDLDHIIKEIDKREQVINSICKTNESAGV